MIEHVRRRALKSGVIEKIIVVSGDDEVLDVVSDYGGDTIKTYKESSKWHIKNCRSDTKA